MDTANEAAARPRMNDLPDEIVHITEGFIPLSRLLTRLAQVTHNSLQDKVMEMSRMPIPAAATNGNAAHGSGAPDDQSVENLNKKQSLLQFAQDAHTKWVKAFVITDWSRKSDMVSKLIDIKFFLDQQRLKYDDALGYMIRIKRDLAFARLPSPDLKTAVQILAAGDASFMPDLGYIDPPPLTPEEQLRWIEELNTLLSIRLNIDDYDKIPKQFKDYSIGSGRVTFKVKGEFELDLTIADEDFEKQFWFLDFRFAFAPATETISDRLRGYLEHFVNGTLAENGLAGCYQFLHEFVLTHKINELKRQALQLRRSLWTECLHVEPLQRALSIQYWASRSPIKTTNTPKHWILVGINSGRKPGQFDGAPGSRIVVKWYRDGKEVPGVEIPMDLEKLSAEDILNLVIGKHIHYILSSLHDKLLATAPRLKEQDPNGVRVSSANTNPADMSLTLHAGFNGELSLLVEPITGALSIKPQSKLFQAEEKRINASRDLAEDGMNALETARWKYIVEEYVRTAVSSAWIQVKTPFSAETVKSMVRIRLPYHALWFQRRGWRSDWYLMALMSMAGDAWWVVQLNPSGGALLAKPLQLDSRTDKPYHLWNHVTTLATGVLAQATDQQAMAQRRIKHRLDVALGPSKTIISPSISVRLTELVPSIRSKSTPDLDARFSSSADAAAEGKSRQQAALPTRNNNSKPYKSKAGDKPDDPSVWAYDNVDIAYKNVQYSSPTSSQSASAPNPAVVGPQGCLLRYVSEATIRPLLGNHAKLLRGWLDSSTLCSGNTITIRMCHELGTSGIDTLIARVKAVARLASFVRALNTSTRTSPARIQCDTIKLGKVQFTYPGATPSGSDAPRRWPVTLDLGRDFMQITLDDKDPHASVSGLLARLANSGDGIACLMKWLPVSLDLFAALISIRHSWNPESSSSTSLAAATATGANAAKLKARQQARQHAERRRSVRLEIDSLDWIMLKYDITLISGARKSVALEIAVRYHDDDPWWHIARVSSDGPGDDPFTAALKAVCEAKNVPYRAFGAEAAAQPKRGTQEMILALDESIKALVGLPPLPSIPAGSRVDAPVVLD